MIRSEFWDVVEDCAKDLKKIHMRSEKLLNDITHVKPAFWIKNLFYIRRYHARVVQNERMLENLNRRIIKIEGMQ